MTLDKKAMVREIGRRTRQTNREVEVMLEALIDVWTESLIAGERIELENFFVLESRAIERRGQSGQLGGNTTPTRFRRIILRTSRKLRQDLNR